MEALECHFFGASEGPDLEKSEGKDGDPDPHQIDKLKGRIRIHIKAKSKIRIRIKEKRWKLYRGSFLKGGSKSGKMCVEVCVSGSASN